VHRGIVPIFKEDLTEDGDRASSRNDGVQEGTGRGSALGMGVTEPKRLYFRMPEPRTGRKKKLCRLARPLLETWNWGIAHAYGVPGLSFHRKAAALGLRLFLLSRIRFRDAYDLMFRPMDSVRYFEFGALRDFLASDALRRSPAVRYLDVSSPRLFPLLWLRENPETEADLVNPDPKDLDITKRLATATGLAGRCRFHCKVVDALDFPAGTFDLITVISVMEHIPEGGDRRAFTRLWDFLRPQGRLLLTVPCAREAFEEYLDFNEYGVLPPDESGYVFGSTFYDAKMIAERFFAVAGPPTRLEVYGERVAGAFVRNRDEKIANPNYPFWREPLMMGREYARFGGIDDLPGLGVVAMEFVKR